MRPYAPLCEMSKALASPRRGKVGTTSNCIKEVWLIDISEVTLVGARGRQDQTMCRQHLEIQKDELTPCQKSPRLEKTNRMLVV